MHPHNPDAPNTPAMAHKPEPTPPHQAQAINRALPYLGSTRGLRWINANGKLRFERPGANPGNGGDQDSDDELPERLMCRHFALAYCKQSLIDPKFHPSALFAEGGITREDPEWFQRYFELPKYCLGLHLLPSARFGEFLAMTFEDMARQAPAEPARPVRGSVTTLCRVYYATTLTHAIAVRLKLKLCADGQWEYVVNVYDPNLSNHHSTCRTRRRQDFVDHPRQYEFLTFLSVRHMQERQQARQLFADNDADTCVQLFELRDLQTPGPAPETFTTDWCANPRIALAHANRAGLDGPSEQCIRRLLADGDAPVDANALRDIPERDCSLLLQVMWRDDPDQLLAWERAWKRIPDIGTRRDLLKGLDGEGKHALAFASQLGDHALASWCGMVASLPVADVVQVLGDGDDEQFGPMVYAFLETEPRLMRQFTQLMDRVIEEDPEGASIVLNGLLPEGLSPLGMPLHCLNTEARDLWLSMLRKLPEPERLFVLAGFNRRHVPFWAVMLAERQTASLERLAKLYADLVGENSAEHLARCLALPPDSPALEALADSADEDIDGFETGLRHIAPWLHDATLDQLEELLM